MSGIKWFSKKIKIYLQLKKSFEFLHVQGVIKTITVIFKFPELHMLDFRIYFFCYVGIHVWCGNGNIRHFGLSVYNNVSLVLVCSSIFYYSNGNGSRRNCIKFCVKNVKLNVQEHLKYWLWRSASLLWAEHKFNCGITGLRKAENMSMTMLVLIARVRQQPMKTLKQWRKCVWLIVESLLERLLMMLAYRSAHAKQLLLMFKACNVRQLRLFQNC